jgi:hypothetical protein
MAACFWHIVLAGRFRSFSKRKAIIVMPTSDVIHNAILNILSDNVCQKLVETIRTESKSDDFSFIQGGCFGFARVLKKVFGGEAYVVASFDKGSNDWPVEHALVKIKGHLYDSTGLIDEKQALAKYGGIDSKIGPKKNWKNLWYPEDFYVGKEDEKVLINLFGKHLPIKEML